MENKRKKFYKSYTINVSKNKKSKSEKCTAIPDQDITGHLGGDLPGKLNCELDIVIPELQVKQRSSELPKQENEAITSDLPVQRAELNTDLPGQAAGQLGVELQTNITRELTTDLPVKLNVELASPRVLESVQEVAGNEGAKIKKRSNQQEKYLPGQPIQQIVTNLSIQSKQPETDLPRQEQLSESPRQVNPKITADTANSLEQHNRDLSIVELPLQAFEQQEKIVTEHLNEDASGQFEYNSPEQTVKQLDQSDRQEQMIEQLDSLQQMDIDPAVVPHDHANSFTVQADIHCESDGIRRNIHRDKIGARNEEIEFCLEEIRSEEKEIMLVNEIVMVIEPEDTIEPEKINDSLVEPDEINITPNNAIDLVTVVSQKQLVKRKINKEKIYKHIDFLSDDDDFAWSSSSWQQTTDSDTDVSDNKLQKAKKTKKKKNQKPEKTNKKSKKDKKNQSNDLPRVTETEGEVNVESNEDLRKKPKKRLNKSLERSRLRNRGEEYITKKGKIVKAKQIRENPCKEGNCPNECFNLKEERREAIFNHYWGLDKNRRRDWLVSNSKKEKVKRKRVKEDTSRRQWTYTYFINEGEGRRPVCLQFLLNTLDIQQKFLHNTVNDNIYGSSKEDLRGRHAPPNKTSNELVESVRLYIQSLPALPSHYCRKNSKKLYLPQEFKNLNNLYRLYKALKVEEGKTYVGEKVFKGIFLSEFNISFHVPRKDKCLKCIKFENDKDNPDLEEEKKLHLQDKEETYTRFGIHQNLHNQDNTVLCTTFDLQKVLNTPYGQSMLLYYSRKLAVYNLTFYESVTREGYCYTWTESEGKRGANEVCTVLESYIQIVDERKSVRHLLLYSDACPGQNRNKTVLACISRCLQKCEFISSIQMNYLLPGHTYMPVDSMHSVIERSVANSIIWAPSQWPTAFSLARKVPKPYDVNVLTHKDFNAWDANAEKYFKGNLTGKISKIRVAMFKKSIPDKIMIKYSMNEDAKTETIDIVGKPEPIKKLYKAPLPISKKKYADLVKLCTNKTIPQIYHQEYKNIPNGSNVHDATPESDIEDEFQD